MFNRIKEEPIRLKVELWAWEKDNGCPWNGRTFALEGGHLAALRWARGGERDIYYFDL
jgi:hypothetical protein